jgi:hypothetical protein
MKLVKHAHQWRCNVKTLVIFETVIKLVNILITCVLALWMVQQFVDDPIAHGQPNNSQMGCCM